VSDVALGAGDALHHAEFVELDHCFGKIEVDRAAALALAVQDHGQIAHAFEVSDLGSIFAARGCVAFDHGIHGGICHAVGAADDAFVDL